jgi:membrane-associated phospholipid phosphatase
MSSRPTHAARRPTLAAAGVLLLLLASGCASTGGGQRWWPERQRWSDALRDAARSPATWAPAIAAAGFAATDWDTKVSDWARRETPLFGSTDGAQQATDALVVAVHLGMVVSALAAPPLDRPAGGRAGRLFLEEGTVLLEAGLVEELKHATTRERPNGLSELSFPSSHATVASASATLANRNLRQSGLSPGARTAFAVGFDVLAAGTAWARVEAGSHYPSDVLAGAALGHFVSAWVYDAWLGNASPPVVAFELSPARHGIAFGLEIRLPSNRR